MEGYTSSFQIWPSLTENETNLFEEYMYNQNLYGATVSKPLKRQSQL